MSLSTFSGLSQAAAAVPHLTRRDMSDAQSFFEKYITQINIPADARPGCAAEYRYDSHSACKSVADFTQFSIERSCKDLGKDAPFGNSTTTLEALKCQCEKHEKSAEAEGQEECWKELCPEEKERKEAAEAFEMQEKSAEACWKAYEAGAKALGVEVEKPESKGAVMTVKGVFVLGGLALSMFAAL